MRMESKLSILLTFSTIFCIHYNIPTANALVGPTVREAEDFEILYAVSFLKNYPPYTNPLESHFCIGTIVSRQHVLSSARCTTYYRHNETAILAGTSNLNYGHLYSVQWWINYAEWARQRHRRFHMNYNDISITKLDREVEDYIPAAMFSPIRTQQLIGREARIIGWAKGRNGNLSNKLQIGNVEFITRTDCEIRLSNLDDRRIVIDEKFLCTVGEPYVILQDGDFGGAIMIGDYIVGINKETRPFAITYFDARKLNIHLNINYFRDFLNAVLSPDYNWVMPIS